MTERGSQLIKTIPVYKDPQYATIIKEINEILIKRFNDGTNLNSVAVPWKEVKRDDLINWPTKVPVFAIYRQGKQSLRLLKSSVDRIRFTQEFLNRHKSLAG